ncbi:MAG: SNF2-related protein [Proteobacteria bacterium]|nr:SNF2-related protein [Pseudomonadota bacterium]
MSIIERIENVVSTYGEEALFEVTSDSEGLLLWLRRGLLEKCEAGNGTTNLLNQYIHLQMLQEEGIARRISNGFLIETAYAVRLDSPLRSLLQIPSPWPGRFEAEIDHSTQVDCEIKLILIDQSEKKVHQYQRKGPLLRLTENEVYLPSEVQWLAIDSVESHKNLNVNERGEYANLLTISKLQQAKNLGLYINLHHFNEIEAIIPESVSVSVKLDEKGNAGLIPAFNGVSPEEVEQRLQQFHKKGRQSFRIKDKILLMDERKLDAVQEILTNKNIPKEQLQTFLDTPTAFLDATLVDLDSGFSLRVHGVTEFTHAYFGETDESGIEWFSAHIATGVILAPSKISQIIRSEDELDEFEDKVKAARETGATQLIYKDKVFDINNVTATNEAIETTRKRITSSEPTEQLHDFNEEDEEKIKVAIDIAKNDAEKDFGDDEVIDDVLYQDPIVWDKYKRAPFDYQERGVRWLLGLSCHTFDLKREDLSKFGSLLADDMGLGKTYMSLVAVNEYLIQGKGRQMEEKPVLVVAPLSLLENWKDEVEMTYKETPFNDIVILQADADLKKYKVQGSGNETSQRRDAGIEQIRYALKVGPEFGMERLDRPKRLVLTTYQTLRDYQFSLARVDWSFVIFDEAQNIKNPNTLVSIAAKALKAHFKLMATGTPVENSLADFWCLMDTAKPGHLNAYQEFRKKYIKPILQATDEDKADVRLGIGKALRNDVGPLMLRRIKEGQIQGLPKKTVYTGGDESKTEKHFGVLSCVMTDRQRESYDNIIELVSEQQESGEGGNPVLAGLQRLRDVSLHPGLVEGGGIPLPRNRQDAESIIAQSGKLMAMMELLRDIQSRRNEKVIIFVINKNLQAFLKAALEKIFEQKVSVINGDTKAISTNRGTATRKTLISDFESEAGFGLIIMSPIAAGTGLTIVGANNVIHLERHWNPAKEAQATDRVYRIGQKKNVNVYLPVLHHPDNEINSFDQNLDRLLNKKTALKDAVVTPEEVDPQMLGGGVFDGNRSAPIRSRTYLPEDLRQLSWEQFEAFVAELLAKYYQGEAMLTKKGADKGADVIIRGTKNILVQVKHIKNERLGSESPLREIFSAQQSYSKAMGVNFDELVVATNAKKISSHVKNQVETFKAKLIDFKKLKEIMKQHQVTERDVLRRLGMKRFVIA